MGRILILSNKGDLSDQLRQDLDKGEHKATVAKFHDAANAIYTKCPDLILVDLTLKGSIIETWRNLSYDLDNVHKPALVIILKDRVRELELLKGISDFIIYPYDPRELEMRIKLILNRYEKIHAKDVIEIGNLLIDPTKYEVTVDGWPVVLTLKEYELLKYLATHRGQVLTREILLDQIWGYDYYGGTRTVDVHIGRLRTKIETKNSFIKTIRGVGYTFTENNFAEE